MGFFNWFNQEILKMDWLYRLVQVLVEDLLGLSLDQRLGASIHFFIYDVIKIFILLSLVIFLISYVQTYFPPARTRQILSGHRGFRANLLAALLGTVTPFCSCSSIPIFIGFTSAGLPLGSSFSFLISSPLVDLASIILLASIFNWRLALAYVIFGLIIAVAGGSLIGRLDLEREVEDFVFSSPVVDFSAARLAWTDRARQAKGQVGEIVSRVWLHILIGVGLGAVIHNYIPQVWISGLLGQDKWYSVILATLVGLPMYADIFGSLAVAEALVTKGVGVGTALSFLMGVTVLSIPSLIMLSKVVKPKLLVCFLSIVCLGVLATGYLFNLFAHLLI